MSGTQRRISGDGGTVIVEAALILPILLLLVMGLVEYASVELQDSQATSAARDGARAGLFDYKNADDPSKTSAAYLAIFAAVESRVDGDKNPTVKVRCLNSGGTTISCASALPDFDLIEVDVEWGYSSITALGFGVPSKITGTTRMALVGEQSTTTTTSTTSTTTTTAPTSTTPPTSTPPATVPAGCSVTSTPQVSGGGANGNSGRLGSPLRIFNISLSSPASCGVPSIRIWPGAGPPGGASIENPLAQPSGTWEITYPDKVDRGWTNGTKTFQILASNGAVINTYTFAMS